MNGLCPSCSLHVNVDYHEQLCTVFAFLVRLWTDMPLEQQNCCVRHREPTGRCGIFYSTLSCICHVCTLVRLRLFQHNLESSWGIHISNATRLFASQCYQWPQASRITHGASNQYDSIGRFDVFSCVHAAYPRHPKHRSASITEVSQQISQD